MRVTVALVPLLALLVVAGCVGRALDPGLQSPEHPNDLAQPVGDLGTVDLFTFDQHKPDLPDLADPGATCFDILTCLDGCGSDECFEGCYLAGSEQGRADFEAFAGCIDTECATLCEDDPAHCQRCIDDVQKPAPGCGGRPQCGQCLEQALVCTNF